MQEHEPENPSSEVEKPKSQAEAVSQVSLRRKKEIWEIFLWQWKSPKRRW
jgi:hypothetical protein